MICIVSHTASEGGWASHAASLAQALDRHEPTALMDLHERAETPLRSAIRRWRVRRSPRSVGIALGAVEQTTWLPTRYRVAFGVAETSRIPRRTLLHLQCADMVWTMSRWGCELLEANGVPADRIRIVPEGVDTTRFVPASGAGSRRDGVFRFLCVGKWEARKGTADLVRSFAAEFHWSEPIELVMHCGTSWPRRRDFKREIALLVAASPLGRARVVPSEPCSPADYLALLQRSDAFVLPTRGEAWGLPIQEAMACGLPCIVTDYSGLREYADESNAFLIRVQAMEKVEDSEFFYPSYDWGVWARPDLEHLRRLMRYVVENREEAKRRGEAARRDTERLWSWDLAARKAMQHIAELRHDGTAPEPRLSGGGSTR